MVDARWEDLRGTELRYDDHTWELTGEVELRETGELLRVRARQVDGVRGRTATLQFGLDGAGESLNPGDLGEVFASLERERSRHYVVVRKDPRRYRYELHSLEYE
jgi:hypothetical protein